MIELTQKPVSFPMRPLALIPKVSGNPSALHRRLHLPDICGFCLNKGFLQLLQTYKTGIFGVFPNL
jgi:hypothetical protein